MPDLKPGDLVRRDDVLAILADLWAKRQSVDIQAASAKICELPAIEPDDDPTFLDSILRREAGFRGCC